jgi:two-component system response regulator
MEPLVLLVDDDPDFLEVAKGAIARMDLRADVRYLNDSAEALRMIGIGAGRGGPPENLVAVFADLDMPGITGWDILRRVRANPLTRQLPVVIVSSSTRPEDVKASYDLGASSYLVKHFELREPGDYLARAVRYWCEQNRVPWAPGAVG